MSNLFTSIDCPPQLDEFVRVGYSLQDIENGLKNLNFKSGSPGWKAIFNPITPLDKAFQIYSLNLIHITKLQAEPSSSDLHTNKILWEQRDRAWTMAATWIIANTSIISNDSKEKQRDYKKLMPEAIRIQCSHELPPGSFVDFPRDTTPQRRSLDLHTLTDRLQQLGLNIKIKAAAQALDEPITMLNIKEPHNYGSLDSLINTSKYVQNNKNTIGMNNE